MLCSDSSEYTFSSLIGYDIIRNDSLFLCIFIGNTKVIHIHILFILFYLFHNISTRSYVRIKIKYDNSDSSHIAVHTTYLTVSSHYPPVKWPFLTVSSHYLPVKWSYLTVSSHRLTVKSSCVGSGDRLFILTRIELHHKGCIDNSLLSRF